MKTGLINTSVASISPGAGGRTSSASAAPPDSAGWAKTMHDAVARKSSAPQSDSQPKTASTPSDPAPGRGSARHKNAPKAAAEASDHKVAHTPDRKKTRTTDPKAKSASNRPSAKDTKQASRSERKKKTAAPAVAAPPVAVPVQAHASGPRTTSTRSDSSHSPAKARGADASHSKDGPSVAQANVLKPGSMPERASGADSHLAPPGQQAAASQRPVSRPPATPRATHQSPADSAKTSVRAIRPGQRQGQSTSHSGAPEQPLAGYADGAPSPTARGREGDALGAKASGRVGAGQRPSSAETPQNSRPSRTDQHGSQLASTGASHLFAYGNGTVPGPTGPNSGLQGTAQTTVANSGPATPINPQTLASLNAQIHTLHQAGGGQTQIDLHPTSLGSVQIHLQMQGQQQAQVSFSAAHASTAQAIQASLPQLVASMQQQGIHLAQPQVHIQNNTNGQNAPSHPGQSSMGQQGQSRNPDGQGGRPQPHTALATHEVAARETPGETATKAGVRAYA